MADLKALLGDKYQEGMTIEDLLALEVEEPKANTAAFCSTSVICALNCFL